MSRVVGTFVAPRVVTKFAVDEVIESGIVCLELDSIADLIMNSVRGTSGSGAIEIHLDTLGPVLITIACSVSLLPQALFDRFVIGVSPILFKFRVRL